MTTTLQTFRPSDVLTHLDRYPKRPEDCPPGSIVGDAYRQWQAKDAERQTHRQQADELRIRGAQYQRVINDLTLERLDDDAYLTELTRAQAALPLVRELMRTAEQAAGVASQAAARARSEANQWWVDSVELRREMRTQGERTSALAFAEYMSQQKSSPFGTMTRVDLLAVLIGSPAIEVEDQAA